MADDSGLPLDRLEAGDLGFVDALRRVHDADALAEFATPWFADRRPASRRLLFEYLDRPFNAFRHEGLVKRLFKRAEGEGDDPLMARFLVLFDRWTRRVRRGDEGAIVHPPGTTMPRGRMVVGKGRKAGAPDEPAPDWARRFRLDWAGELGRADVGDLPEVLERFRPLRLFGLATRLYLKRRAWRYFRKLGRADPGRYVLAASEALALYRDEDAADGLALLDNWGLVHILFHHDPALEARPGGWTTRPGKSLAGLAPAPIFGEAWDEAPGAVVGLLASARSSVVRRWAIRRVEADPDRHRPALPPGGWLDLLRHADPGVVALAAEMLDWLEGVDDLDLDRWVALAGSVAPSALPALCARIAARFGPDRATPAQAVALAVLRPPAAASLGFSWLARMEIGPADLPALLPLADADCESLRPEMTRWLRDRLAGSPGLDPSMVLALLESRHADVRREGLDWLRAEPRAVGDTGVWARLLDSPHADVRLALVAELEAKAAGKGLDPGVLRRFWASVLLDVRRGSRAKPAAIRQVARRLEARPDEAADLLPLLGVVLRSIRGPERRAALVAVVGLVEARPELGATVGAIFPELQIGEGAGKVRPA